MRQLTLAQCEAIAEREDARLLVEFADASRAAAEAAHFESCSKSDLVRMWTSGRNLKSRKLNDFEFRALCEAWVRAFDSLPPAELGIVEPVTLSTASRPEPDTMLNMHDVSRLTGLSESTIKRMVIDGRFPAPIKLSPRRNGWVASSVIEWRDTRPA